MTDFDIFDYYPSEDKLLKEVDSYISTGNYDVKEVVPKKEYHIRFKNGKPVAILALNTFPWPAILVKYGELLQVDEENNTALYSCFGEEYVMLGHHTVISREDDIKSETPLYPI